MQEVESAPQSDLNEIGNDLPRKLVDEMQGIFGRHPGYRSSTLRLLLVLSMISDTQLTWRICSSCEGHFTGGNL